MMQGLEAEHPIPHSSSSFFLLHPPHLLWQRKTSATWDGFHHSCSFQRRLLLFPAAIKHSVHIRVEGWSARNSPAVAESIHVARRTNTVTHWYRAPGFSLPHNCITALYSLCVRVRAHSRFSGVLFFFWLGFCSRVVLIEAIDRVYCVCVTTPLHNGCVRCTVTKLFNYSELTSSSFLSSSLISLCTPLPIYMFLYPFPHQTVVIGMRLESQCRVLSGPTYYFGEILCSLALLVLFFKMTFCPCL